MSQLTASLLLGFLHTALVLAVAWLVTRDWAPYRAGRATTIVRTATVLSCALVCAAFLPIPNFTSSFVSQIRAWQNARDTARAPVPLSSSELTSDTIGVRLGIGSEQFRLGQTTATRYGTVREGSAWSTWTIPIAFSASLFFAARQLLGMWSLFWLCRSSQHVEDEKWRQDLARLRREMHCEQHVALRTTELIAAPATAGWLRPVILLPQDYQTNSTMQRRAVLAHELAHVKNGDFVWRIVAGFFAAIHFCNPLAHWLRDRLVLEQELIADRIASDFIGSRRAYVRALSQLAMRADEASFTTTYTGLLSVTSTHLLRRIAMLRAKDGSTLARPKRFGPIAVALLTTTAIVTTGLRATAEAPPAAKSTATPSKVTPFEMSRLPLLQQGAFVVRPSLLVSDEQGLYGAVLQSLASKTLKDLNLPDVPLAAVELIAGSVHVGVLHTGKTIEPNDEGHEHQLALGSNTLLVRLHDAQDLRARIYEFFPNTEVLDEAKQIYLLPTIHPMGPYRARVKIVDHRTFAVSYKAGGLDWTSNFDQEPESKPAWHKQWQAIDRGAVTLLIDQTAMHWPKTKTTWPQHAQHAIANTDFLAFSLMPGEQMTLQCEATVSEKSSDADAQLLVENLRKLAAGGDGAPSGSLLPSWINTAKVTRVDRTIQFQGPIAIPFGSMVQRAQVEQESRPFTNSEQQVQVKLKLVDINVDRLRELDLEFLNDVQIAADASNGYSKTEIAHMLFLSLNKNPSAALRLIKEKCGKGRASGLGQLLAEPTLTTVSNRPVSFGWGENSISVLPHGHDDGEWLPMTIKLRGSTDWETDIVVRPSQTHFLPVPGTIGKGETRRLLVIQADVMDEAEVAATARGRSESTTK